MTERLHVSSTGQRGDRRVVRALQRAKLSQKSRHCTDGTQTAEERLHCEILEIDSRVCVRTREVTSACAWQAEARLRWKNTSSLLFFTTTSFCSSAIPSLCTPHLYILCFIFLSRLTFLLRLQHLQPKIKWPLVRSLQDSQCIHGWQTRANYVI